MGKSMEKLLQWSIDAAQNPGNAKSPDPELLAQLFGFDNPQTNMHDDLQLAVQGDDLEHRCLALEDFSDLVEDLNNANEIGKLWEPLLYLINDQEPKIRGLALGAVGAAVQNNDKSQADLVSHAGVSKIMEHIGEKDRDVAAKALFALASALGHCAAAYEQFVADQGWQILTYIFDNETVVDNTLDKKQQRLVSVVGALVSVQQYSPVFSELEKTPLIAHLEKWYPASGAYKERIEHIFEQLKDSSYGQPRLLGP